MQQFDRLTTLIDRFKLTVSPAAEDEANLIVFATANGTPDRAVFCTRDAGSIPLEGPVLFYARVDWSGPNNPFLKALPETVHFDLSHDQDSIGLAQMMLSELTAHRCGAGSVLSRLGEVLIVRMMRAQIETGSTQPGLLAGLSDQRLSRAIVAMHDRPGHAWRNEDLAALAGMSLSRFAETFLAEVGEPPAKYLRRWRLILSRQDIVKGHRVDAVARRYGFASPEGFTRAFKKHYGATPMSLRSGRPV
ncbi:MAG: AraC family transcriptional regulator [Rhodobacteraceae bacterium]|nr:AraC family transcriptional regulator [Paracoccaceae bacterium]